MRLEIAQVILDRATFAHRDDYLSLPPNTPIPASSITVMAEVARQEDNPHGSAFVKLNATSKDNAPYHFDVCYGVIYTIHWDADEQVPENLDQRLMVTGATMLFPFVREAVANLTARGRFGPTWLSPVNLSKLVVARDREPEGAGAAP